MFWEFRCSCCGQEARMPVWHLTPPGLDEMEGQLSPLPAGCSVAASLDAHDEPHTG